MICENDLLRLRRGDMTFDSFASKTRGDFLRLAYRLSLTLPPWMDMEDLAHEMLLEVPVSLRQWRPGDYRLKAFVIFRSCARASKVAARARGKSFAEVPDDDENMMSAVPGSSTVMANQLDRIEMAERIRDLETTLPRTPMQLAVLRALGPTQDMNEAAKVLMRHPDTRVMFAADHDLVRSKLFRVMTLLADRAVASK